MIIDRLKLFLILTIIIILTFYLLQYLQKEYFQNNTTTTTQSNISGKVPMDRTLLYGSLFLDKLDEVNKNMTNPDIKYDTKRLELFRYYDVLY